MNASIYAITLIKTHEGLRLKAYQCSAGKWTIGYGSTKGVMRGLIISPEQAETRLQVDIRSAENDLKALVKTGLHQCEFDALISFVFNVGYAQFKGSSLLRRLNAGERNVGEEFERWVWETDLFTGLKRRSPGLVKRRRAERALYESRHPSGEGLHRTVLKSDPGYTGERRQ